MRPGWLGQGRRYPARRAARRRRAAAPPRPDRMARPIGMKPGAPRGPPRATGRRRPRRQAAATARGSGERAQAA
eukprot:scaffold25045_cov90-Isochrysis_galbana.AAC.6